MRKKSDLVVTIGTTFTM